MIEPKDFQEQPSQELADALNEVAKLAREKYGELVFSKFLYSQAYLYRSKEWEANWKTYEAVAKQMEAQLLAELEEEALSNIDPKEGTVH